MARNASDINPQDKFPKRDLGGDSEKWGRTIEDRIIALEKAALGGGTSIQATNRALASSTASLADQIKSVVYVESLYETASGFAVPAKTSAVVATTRVNIPLGFTRASYSATMWVTAYNDSGSPSLLYSGLELDGVYIGILNSATTPAGVYGVSTYTRTGNLEGLTPGGTLTFGLRAKGDPPWGSTGTLGYIAGLVTFLR